MDEWEFARQRKERIFQGEQGEAKAKARRSASRCMV